MGLLDVLNGMQNGPRGQRDATASSQGMSPLTMAVLGLLAYKAFKSFTGNQPAAETVGTPRGTQPASRPGGPINAGMSGGGLGDLLSGGLGGLLASGAAGSVLSGGLNELLKQFQQSGQGDVAKSWVGTGPNRRARADRTAARRRLGPAAQPLCPRRAAAALRSRRRRRLRGPCAATRHGDRGGARGARRRARREARAGGPARHPLPRPGGTRGPVSEMLPGSTSVRATLSRRASQRAERPTSATATRRSPGLWRWPTPRRTSSCSNWTDLRPDRLLARHACGARGLARQPRTRSRARRSAGRRRHEAQTRQRRTVPST